MIKHKHRICSVSKFISLRFCLKEHCLCGWPVMLITLWWCWALPCYKGITKTQWNIVVRKEISCGPLWLQGCCSLPEWTAIWIFEQGNCFGERPIPSKLALCVYVPETDIYALHSSLTKHSKPTKSQLEQFKLNKNIYKQKSTYFLRPKTKLTSQITMTESKAEKQNFHWNTYKMWNNRILGETHFRKKAFRRI